MSLWLNCESNVQNVDSYKREDGVGSLGKEGFILISTLGVYDLSNEGM